MHDRDATGTTSPPRRRPSHLRLIGSENGRMLAPRSHD
jgi:hypothetical protein